MMVFLYVQEAGFKPGPDSSYFNAFGSVNETFKVVEDAIAASGANTADGKIFKIGINCEGESYFNKEPKDPNKYEVEGLKTQGDQDQLADYYLKVCNEHPLVVYLEDPYANNDIKGYQKIMVKFKNSAPHVKIGVKAMFADGNMQKLKSLTNFVLTESQENLLQENPDANKDKFTPHVVHLSRHHSKTVSDTLESFRLVNSYQREERKFTFIMDDGKFESSQGSVVDLAFGIGCEYLNVQGFIKSEKLAKVQRFTEIIEEIRAKA